MFNKLKEYMKRQKTHKALYQLTDRELRDIGITRGEIIRL